MTSSSVSLLPCLQILEQNDFKLDSEAIEKILKELLIELDKSQVKQCATNYTILHNTFRRNWNRQGNGIYRKLKKLKGKSGTLKRKF